MQIICIPAFIVGFLSNVCQHLLRFFEAWRMVIDNLSTDDVSFFCFVLLIGGFMCFFFFFLMASFHSGFFVIFRCL